MFAANVGLCAVYVCSSDHESVQCLLAFVRLWSTRHAQGSNLVA